MSEVKFEKAMEDLEKIVNDLERGELPLDKAVEVFEKGSKLVELCQKKLADAEMKIEKVKG